MFSNALYATDTPMMASMMYAFAWTPPSTPSSSVVLWPSVNRLTYSRTSLSRYRKKMTPTRNGQMIVAGDHVLGTEVQERPDCGAVDRLDERGVTPGDPVRERDVRHKEQPYRGYDCRPQRLAMAACLRPSRTNGWNDADLERERIVLGVAVSVDDEALSDPQLGRQRLSCCHARSPSAGRA